MFQSFVEPYLAITEIKKPSYTWCCPEIFTASVVSLLTGSGEKCSLD